MSRSFNIELPAAPTSSLLDAVRAELARLPIRVELPPDLDLLNDAGWVPVAVHALDHVKVAGHADCPHWSGFEYDCAEEPEGSGRYEVNVVCKLTTGNVAALVVAASIAAAGRGVLVETDNEARFESSSARDIIDRILALADEEFDPDVGEYPPFTGWEAPMDEPDDDELE